jgi:cysteine-rich repeat protein
MQRLSLRIHPLGLCVLGFTLSIGLSACSDDPSTTVDKDVAADSVADTLADVVDPDVSGCGDGVMLGDEACDDGNVVDGDGCSATCTLETGFDCTGVPTVCTDIDECAATPSGCDLAADCTNTVGAFTCTCKPGYVGDGKVCTPKEDCGAVACDDSNPCTDDSCDKATGCVHANNTVPCTDDNVCTEGDVCGDGLCVAGAAKDCDDKNVCTTDSCDPLAGCANTPNTEPCTDGDACTTGDLCAAGACVPGGATVCDDSNPCTDDACDLATGCTVTVNTAPCDDKDACTTGDTCALGACVPGGPTVCDDSNPCTDDACDLATGCTVTDNIAVCTDGDACTTGDICALGACVPGGPTVCDDSNPCTDDGCDLAIGCTVTDNIAVCTDGDACTTGDLCALGACVSGGPTVCDDSNPCTDDGCDLAIGCTVTDNIAVCTDGDACTTGDICALGACVSGGPTVCDDSNPCTDDACDPATGCTVVNNVAPCDDKNACTDLDVCKDASCVPGGPTVCTDGNSCTDNACDPATGCTVTPNTKECEDGNACTLTDKCTDGSCVAGAIDSCDDSKPCTTDSCDPVKGCANVANTSPCEDGSACTVGDICAAGACKPGAAKSCDDSKPCTTDSCDPVKGCANVANTSACEDGNACTLTDKCKDGSCVAGAINSCDDSNPFTLDTCNAATGCAHAAKTCDPGYSCAPVTGACTMKVLISEVYWAGHPLFGKDDYVELYNPGETPASLKGLYVDLLQPYTSSWAPITGDTGLAAGVTIPAHGYFLISNHLTDNTGVSADSVAPDENVLSNMSRDNGAVRLRIAGKLDVLDLLGWGNQPGDFEGTPFPFPMFNSAIGLERKAYASSTTGTMRNESFGGSAGVDALKGNSYDTNNNANDFVMVEGYPTRQNTASPIEKP